MPILNTQFVSFMNMFILHGGIKSFLVCFLTAHDEMQLTVLDYTLHTVHEVVILDRIMGAEDFSPVQSSPFRND